MKMIDDRRAVAYATPYLQGLLPSLCVELAHFEAVIKAARRDDERDDIRILRSLRERFAAHHEGLALFLAHPTRRLLLVMESAVAEAEKAVGWLIDHPRAPPSSSPNDFTYVAICERIRMGIADWRLAIDLSRVYHDLDSASAETLQ